MRTSSLAVCATAALFAVTTVAAQTSSAPAGGTASPARGASSTQGSTTSKAQGEKRSMHVPQGQTRKQTFDKLDTNHDGMISLKEAQADPDLVIIFVGTDADNDGQLSPAEFIVVPITQEDGSAVR